MVFEQKVFYELAKEWRQIIKSEKYPSIRSLLIIWCDKFFNDAIYGMSPLEFFRKLQWTFFSTKRLLHEAVVENTDRFFQHLTEHLTRKHEIIGIVAKGGLDKFALGALEDVFMIPSKFMTTAFKETAIKCLKVMAREQYKNQYGRIFFFQGDIFLESYFDDVQAEKRMNEFSASLESPEG